MAVHKPTISYVKKIISNSHGNALFYNHLEIDENIDIIVDHFQIDNMVSWENPVLVCPKKVLDKADKEETKEEEEYTPFVQLSKIIVF